MHFWDRSQSINSFNQMLNWVEQSFVFPIILTDNWISKSVTILVIAVIVNWVIMQSLINFKLNLKYFNITMLVGAVSSSVQVKMTHSIMIGFWRRLGSATITKDSLAEGRLFLLWRAWAEMWHFLISFSHQTIFRPKVKVRYLVSQSWANSVFCSSCDWIIWIKRTCFGNGLGLCDSKNSSQKRILIIII